MCCNGIRCMCWLIASMILSLITMIMFLTYESVLGGPIPTYNFHMAGRMSIVGTVFNAIGCILAFVALMNTKKLEDVFIIFKWIGFGIINIFLVISACLFLAVMIAFASRITAEDVIEYGKDYQEGNNGMMPPAMAQIETLSGQLGMHGIPLGCCGHTDFNDYAGDEKRAVIVPCKPRPDPSYRKVLFKGQKTCCKRRDNHGKCENNTYFENLDYINHDILLYLYKLLIKHVQNATTVNDVIAQVQTMGTDFGDWISSDKGRTKTAGEEERLPPSNGIINFQPKYDCNSVLKSQMKFYLGDWDNDQEWNSDADYVIDNRGRNRTAKNKKNIAKNYENSVVLDVHIGVLGCGGFLEYLFGGHANFFEIIVKAFGAEFYVRLGRNARICIIVFLVIVTILKVLNLVFFNYYCCSLILFAKNKVNPQPRPQLVKEDTRQQPVESGPVSYNSSVNELQPRDSVVVPEENLE